VGTKSLIVSLHDAHPGSRAQIEEQVALLAAYGITRSSILVVPEFHHGPAADADAAFVESVNKWQADGHEIVLHGYFHDRKESPRENLRTLFWTRLYTSQEAEFLDLPINIARERLEMGRALFEKQGWRTTGFIAPAWLMADGLTDLLAEMGFAYTNRVGEIMAFGKNGTCHIPSQSLCYSTRAAWRRFA
jgi:predicted deacetylase